MFYEDIRIGQSADLGQTEFSREAILAYGKRFDPRIVAQAAEGRRGSPPRGCMWPPRGCADWWTRAAPCAPLWPSAARPFRSLASRQASKTCAGHTRSMRAISFRIRWRRCRNARPPSRNGVSSTNIFRGVNQRGQEVLVFSSAVLIARRPRSFVMSCPAEARIFRS